MEIHFANNLRFLRKQNGWSLEYVSDALGLKSFTTVSKWEVEATSPRMDTLVKLCELFHVGLNEMVYDDLEGQNKQTEAQIAELTEAFNNMTPEEREKLIGSLKGGDK